VQAMGAMQELRQRNSLLREENAGLMQDLVHGDMSPGAGGGGSCELRWTPSVQQSTSATPLGTEPLTAQLLAADPKPGPLNEGASPPASVQVAVGGGCAKMPPTPVTQSRLPGAGLNDPRPQPGLGEQRPQPGVEQWPAPGQPARLSGQGLEPRPSPGQNPRAASQSVEPRPPPAPPGINSCSPRPSLAGVLLRPANALPPFQADPRVQGGPSQEQSPSAVAFGQPFSFGKDGQSPGHLPMNSGSSTATPLYDGRLSTAGGSVHVPLGGSSSATPLYDRLSNLGTGVNTATASPARRTSPPGLRPRPLGAEGACNQRYLTTR